jgi:hypothetical protein
MTIEEEIEQAIRSGAHPLFLYGLVHLAGRGPAEATRLTTLIDRIGQRIYLRKEGKTNEIAK